MRQKLKMFTLHPEARQLETSTLLAFALILSLLSVPGSAASSRLTTTAMELSIGRDAAVRALPPGGVDEKSVPDFGRLGGKFRVSDDGAAQYSLPLWMPRGRGSVAPSLTLSYSSRGGEGPFGVGWSLGGLSVITWCPRTIAQDGKTDGLHTDGSSPLCLDGNRLLPVSPPYSPIREYRTERATFARIVGYETQDNVPDFFRMWTKDGRILTFGETGDSRMRAYQLKQGPDLEKPSMVRGSRVTVAWGLNRVEDRNGNASTVTYRRAEGSEADLWGSHMLPASVAYAPNRRVDFHYEPRTDPIDRFTHGGVHTLIRERVKSIEMWAGPEGKDPELVRSYLLQYQNNSVTGRSLLHMVRECDHDGTCKLPLRFDWSLGSYESNEVSVPGNLGTKDGWRIQIADVNGDGRDDLIHRNDGRESPAKTWIRRSFSNFFAPLQASFTLPQASLPHTVAVDSTGEPQMRIVDVDGDGRSELAALIPNDPSPDWYSLHRWRMFKSTGTGFSPADDRGGIGDPYRPDRGDSHRAYFADLDGNGLPDFVEVNVFDPPAPGGYWRYRLNSGLADPDRFSRRMQKTGIPRTSHGIENYVMDTDGDGRAEILMSRGSPQVGWDSWGLRADCEASCEPERRVLNLDEHYSDALFGDLNGDGLDDKISLTKLPDGRQALQALINSGTGFFEVDPTNVYGNRRHPIKPGDLRIVDFNNDGRDDVLIIKSETYIGSSEAKHRVELRVWTGSSFALEELRVFELSCKRDCNWSGTQPLDVDADGLTDLVHFASGNKELQLFNRRGELPDRLIGIGDGHNQRNVEIGYTNLADRKVHTPGTPGRSCSYPLVCPASGGSIVAWHRIATNVDSWDKYHHNYGQARLDLQGRGWLGFAEHSVRRDQTEELTVTKFDNSTRVVAATAEHPAATVYPYAGIPKEVTTEVRDVVDNNQYRDHRRSVGGNNKMRRYADGSFFVEQRNTLEKVEERPQSDPVWQVVREATTKTVYDEFGNKEFASATTKAGRAVIQDVDYSNAPMGRPGRMVVTGCTAGHVCTTRETTFDYDDRGNPWVMVVEPNNPKLKLTITTTYGQFGVVKSITRADDEGNVRANTYEYDNADQLYPTAIINALGHRTLVETHSGLGVPLRTIDPNGAPATMRYDRFGRLREINHADGSFEHVEHAVLLTPYTGLAYVTTSVAGGGSTTVEFDRLGRESKRWVESFDGRRATTYTGYDVLNRIDRVSLPAGPGEEAQYTRFKYDQLDRIKSVTAPDEASVRYEYRGRETHTYDAKGVHSYTTNTVDGEVQFSYEDDPHSTDWLRTGPFEYGPFGEPTKMVAPDNTEQTIHYDLLGRRERLEDPSSGTTTTTYNAFGDITSITDAENHVTTFDEYDELGRVKKKTSPDGIATNIWDTAAHGLGRLAQARSADGVTIDYTYDDLGKNETTTWTIEGTGYEFQYGYDNIGRLACLSYPEVPGAADRLTVGYSYNPAGYLAQVTDGCATGGQPYWAAEAINGAGQLERERYGNGVVTTRTYRPDTGLLDRIQTTGPGTVGQLGDIAYDYDANRNVETRNDQANQRSEFYHYDVLNRLDEWTVQAVPELPAMSTKYAYDAVGNLRTETVQAPNQPETTTIYRYGEDGAPPHALTALNNQKYGYDRAGRQTSGPNRTVEYNTFGLPTILDWTSSQGQARHTTFAYDPDGERVIKRDNAQTTVTMAGLFERRTPAGTGLGQIHNLHNIIVGGRVIAQVNRVQAAAGGPVTPSRVTYLHTDLQGSTVTLTNSNGELSSDDSWLRQQFYEPFGVRINARNEPEGDESMRDGPRQGYTGHDHDVEYGLINMKGRIYDPEARRFLTPDPILQNPLASQGHNRYTYVQNNPSTLTDPTGWQGCAPEDASCLPDPDWGPSPGPGSGPDLGDLVEGVGEVAGKVGGLFSGLFGGGGSGGDHLYGSNAITPDGVDDDVSWTEETTSEQLIGTQGEASGIVLPYEPMTYDQILGEAARTTARLESERIGAEMRALGIDAESESRQFTIMLGGGLLLAAGGFGIAALVGAGGTAAAGTGAGGLLGGGAAISAKVGVTAAGVARVGPEGWTRVQRWMSNAEAVKWAGRSSMPQPLPSSLGYSVSQSGAARAGAAVNQVLIEFEVPTQWLQQGGRVDWFVIYNQYRHVPIRDLIIR